MNLRALDVSEWGFFRFRGDDAKIFLQGLITADVATLKPGDCLPACVLTPKGMLVADFELYDRDDGLLAVTRPAAADGFFEAFSKKIMLARSTFERLRPRAFLVIGEGFGGGLPWRRLDSPASLLIDAAPPQTASSLSSAEFNARRVAAGIPLFGVDMNGETLPLEARQQGAISLTKGCYMGQETVSRLVHRGHVNRKLVRLRFAGASPAAGAGVSRESSEVGRITSSAGEWALAMVRADAAEPGGRLSAGGVFAAVVD